MSQLPWLMLNAIINAQLADDEVVVYFCASARFKNLKTTAMTVYIDEVKI